MPFYLPQFLKSECRMGSSSIFLTRHLNSDSEFQSKNYVFQVFWGIFIARKLLILQS